jgi:hypothetical protein
MIKKILFSVITIALLLFLNLSFSQTPNGTANLGILTSFEAFTGAGAVANSGGTITGDVGTHLGIVSGLNLPAYTGNAYNGNTGPGNIVTTQARYDLLRLYIHLNDKFVDFPAFPPAFGAGQTITPGVYSTIGAGSIGGALTLDGGGNPDAFFVIKMNGAMTVGAAAAITLINGAKSCNVFWIINGAISVAAAADIKGTLFSKTGAVGLGAGTLLEGRMLTMSGAITLGIGAIATLPPGASTIPIFCEADCSPAPAVDVLGSLSNFTLFASVGNVGNTGISGINGNIGTNAGAITGYTNGVLIGTEQIMNTVTAQAALDLDAAYIALMALTPTGTGLATYLNETITPGVYAIPTAGALGGTITLDAGGNPDAIFVFRFAGAFNIAASSKMILTNGARRCNIFWLAGAGVATGALNIGASAEIKGTFIAHGGACNSGGGVFMSGRQFSTSGAVNTDNAVIYNNPECVTSTSLGAPAPAAVAQSFCASNKVNHLVASGTDLKWYSTSTGGSVLSTSDLLIAGTYYVSQTLNNVESDRTSVVVTINPNSWLGTTGSAWNVATNWSCGFIPISPEEILITTSTPHAANLNVAFTVGAGKTLTISGSGSLTIAAKATLTIAGTVDFGDKAVVFQSNATGSGSLGPITGTLTGATNVTTERYIPARRAFRFLSPSVTTTTGISANWQENAGTATNLGTHITGAGGPTNGFDASSTNNPSLFTFTAGAWQAVTNTNTTTLTAGTGYRLMVRGDRTLSLATNTPTPTTTVLRATGTLKTGNHNAVLNNTAAGFSFVGNPYQAPVNMKDVINASSNMNTSFMYYWDPTLNSRGGYVTRNLNTDNNDVTSGFNEFVQPGQAVFVQKDNTATVATLTFTEANKAVGNVSAGMFRTPASTTHSALRLKLMTTLNNTLTEVDGALLLFDNGYSWNFDSNDAIKLGNLDEQVAIIIDQQQVAIASQSVPNDNDMLAISLANFRQAAYQWHFELDNYTGPAPFLHDTVLGTLTQITTATVIPFTVDNRITGSYENRFQLLFQDTTLSTPSLNNTITAYPNPARGGDDLFITNVSPTAIISVRNLLGQQTAVSTSPHNNGLVVKPRSSLSAGIYVVAISDNNNTTVIKWIIN